MIVGYGMGITQHRHGTGNVQQIANLLLLRGNMGRPGAGICPVRGHSNVQGDRTVGINERPAGGFPGSDGRSVRLRSAPTAHGHAVVDAIGAMIAGTANVFIGLGGNFVAAVPDKPITEAAMRRLRLTVGISTKLNRGHLVHGEQALILPCLARSDIDMQATGRPGHHRGRQHVHGARLRAAWCIRRANSSNPKSRSSAASPKRRCRADRALIGTELEGDYDVDP